MDICDGNRFHCGAKRQRQTQHRTMKIKRRQRFTRGYDLFDSLDPGQQTPQRLVVTLQHNFSAPARYQWNITHKLHRITKSLLGMNQDSPPTQIFAMPLRAPEIPLRLTRILLPTAPFIFRPPVPEIPLCEQRECEIKGARRDIPAATISPRRCIVMPHPNPLFPVALAFKERPCVGIPGRRASASLITSNGFIQLPILPQRCAERGERLWKVWFQRHRPPMVSDRLLKSAQFLQNESPAVARISKGRHAPNRLELALVPSLRRISPPRTAAYQAIPGPYISGLKAPPPAEKATNRFVEPANRLWQRFPDSRGHRHNWGSGQSLFDRR